LTALPGSSRAGANEWTPVRGEKGWRLGERGREGGREGGRVGGDEKLVVMDLFDGKDVVVVGGCQG